MAKSKKKSEAYEIVNTRIGTRRLPDGTVLQTGANRVSLAAFEFVKTNDLQKKLVKLGILQLREVTEEPNLEWDGELPVPVSIDDYVPESVERIVNAQTSLDILSRYLDQDGRPESRKAVLARALELKPKEDPTATKEDDE